MTTAGLRGYLDTQKSEFLREVRTPLRFFPELFHESALGPVGRLELNRRSVADHGEGGGGLRGVPPGVLPALGAPPVPALAVRRAPREQAEPGALS